METKIDSRVYTTRQVAKLFASTETTIRRWIKEERITPLHFSSANEDTNFLFNKDYIDCLLNPSNLQSNTKDFSTIAIAGKASLLMYAINKLPYTLKKRALNGELLATMKHLDTPSQEEWESIILSLEGVTHENFWWSKLGAGIMANNLVALMGEVRERTGAPIIVIMEGGYRRKGIEVQNDNKIILFASGLPDAIQILRDFKNR